MGIEVRWLNNANKQLSSVYHYIAHEKLNKSAARQLVKKIQQNANTLKVFPQAGSIEPMLKENPKCYRGLVVDVHYKLIYTIKDEQTVEIAAVWDCRQDPMKLQQML